MILKISSFDKVQHAFSYMYYFYFLMLSDKNMGQKEKNTLKVWKAIKEFHQKILLYSKLVEF